MPLWAGAGAMRGISVPAYAIATTPAVLWVVYGFATDRLGLVARRRGPGETEVG